MPDLPTRLDLYAIGRDYLLQRATKIDPAQVDIEGSNVNIFVGSGSVVSASVVTQLAYATSRLTLDGAEGDDLDRLAWDRYNLVRKGASPAVGRARIFRSTLVGGAGTVALGSIVQSLAGIEYITTTLASFGAGDFESAANVRAVQAGKATQVGVNGISSFASGTRANLFDRTLQVTNDITTAGGEDVEDDDTFRNRIRDFWNNARKGILSAIVQGALVVPGVVSAQAIESFGNENQPSRVVNLYIADSSGVANPVLAQLVSSSLDEYRAAGIMVIVWTSIPFIVDLLLALSYRAGVDTVSLSDAIRIAVTEFVNNLPVNGTLFRGELMAVLQRFVADGLVINDTSIVSPVGDLIPDIGQTLRTTLANVVITTP